MYKIPYGKQDISQQDIDAVVSVLKSDFLTQGPLVQQFEKSLTDLTSVNHAIAVNSGTSALHIAYLALEVKDKDIVWTTPNTFVATANAARFCGADIDFVDVDAKTYNMCPVKLEEKLKAAKASGKLPKVVTPVHFAGQSCDMKKIFELSREYGFKIIEDASHAVGAKYLDQAVGSCKYSDITVFSFHPVKIITTAEGGAALTNSSDLAQRMKLLASHHVTRDEELMIEESHGPWYYQQVSIGFNYRLTDMQAALGLSQMKRIHKFIEKRHELVKNYEELLQDLPLERPYQSPDTYSSFHLYVVKVKNRKHVFNHLKSRGIGASVHYIPVHLQPYYKSLGFRLGDFVNSEEYYEKTVTLPLYYNLTLDEQKYVVDCLKEAIL